MAGDLLLENVPQKVYDFLTAYIGATFQEHIFHADKPWAGHEARYTQQKGVTENDRTGLPAHSYFSLSNHQVAAIRKYKATMKTLLDHVERPLGIVSSKASLADWDANPNGRVDMLIDALEREEITFEYYKFEGTALKNGENTPGYKFYQEHDE
ncbi:MAG: hypothetical protein AAF074_19650 [Pseudomonadota bacterium]